MQYSNSINLTTAEEAIADLEQNISGLRVTLTRAKTFRRQLRKITGTPRDGSVVKAVRALKAENDDLKAQLTAYRALGSALRSLGVAA